MKGACGSGVGGWNALQHARGTTPIGHPRRWCIRVDLVSSEPVTCMTGLCPTAEQPAIVYRCHSSGCMHALFKHPKRACLAQFTQARGRAHLPDEHALVRSCASGLPSTRSNCIARAHVHRWQLSPNPVHGDSPHLSVALQGARGWRSHRHRYPQCHHAATGIPVKHDGEKRAARSRLAVCHDPTPSWQPLFVRRGSHRHTRNAGVAACCRRRCRCWCCSNPGGAARCRRGVHACGAGCGARTHRY